MKVNVGTIGHIDHGETTLRQALVAVLGEEMAASRLQGIVKDTKHSMMDDFNEICNASPYAGRPKNRTRKAAWKARLKAAQLKSFGGEK